MMEIICAKDEKEADEKTKKYVDEAVKVLR